MPRGHNSRKMNFAGKKLNGFYNNTGDLSVREKRLLAENRKLKKKNKRLSSAMLYLVGHIEARLPIWNTKAKAALQKSETPSPVAEEKPRRKLVKPVQPKKKKIIGKTWKPEHLEQNIEDRPQKKLRKNSLNIQQIFGDKKQLEEKLAKSVGKTSEVVKFQPPEKNEPETPQVVELSAEPEIIEAEEISSDTHSDLTPNLAPEEVSLLAAPIKDRKMDIIHPHSSEVIGEQDDLKTSAKEASMAYLAVSVAAKPVPKSDVITVLDDNEIAEADLLEKQVAQQNEMMRAAMLRRVNRLRW